MVLARPMVKRPMRSRSRPMPIIANSSGTSSTALSTWVATRIVTNGIFGIRTVSAPTSVTIPNVR